jgi:Ca2+-binding RTX toxin-like protein
VFADFRFRGLQAFILVGAASVGMAPATGAVAQGVPTCGSVAATIVGTEGDDVLVGTDDLDYIVGLGGDDIIRGLENSDRLCGNDGADTIYGGPGYDWVEGDAGIDVVKDRDFISGTLGSGDDLVHRAIAIQGGPGDDTIVGFRHKVPVDFQGGAGDDLLIGSDACVECAGDGDYLDGGRGSDIIRGRSRLNVITPGPGRDTIHMGRHRMTWSGRLNYADAARSMRVNLRSGIARGQGRDLLFGVTTQVFGSDFGDKLVGAHEAENLVGRKGDDVIKGRAGNDILFGGKGVDLLVGGDGDDTCRGGIKRRC